MKKLYLVKIICLFLMQSMYAQQTFKATYGVSGFNYGVATRPAANGGFMAFGNRTGVSGNSDIYCVRIDSVGFLQYDKIIDFGNLEVATDVCYIKDQGYGIIGYTYVSAEKGYDMLLIRTDTACNVLWSKTYGGNDWDMAYSIISLPDSGFLFCGETYSNTAGQNDGFLCRTNALGDTIWTKKVGGSGSDILYALDSTNNNNFYAAGTTDSYGAIDKNVLYMKFNIDGDTLWAKQMGGAGQNEKVFAASSTLDYGLVMGGVSSDTVANSILLHYILRVDSVGNYLWHEIPFWLPRNDEIQSIHQRSDSTFVYAGYTENFGGGGKDMLVYYLKNDMSERYGNTIGNLYTESATDVIFTTDGGCILTGNTDHEGLFVNDIYVVKLDSVLNFNSSTMHFTGVEEMNHQEEAVKLHVYPNPADNYTNISLNINLNVYAQCNIYTMQGILIYSKPIRFVEGKALLQTSSFAASVYVISIQTSEVKFENCLFIKK